MRDADGAGLAAIQVYEPIRICAIEVRNNPRYPYKPQIPLTILVNPVLTPVDDEHVRQLRGLPQSVPNLRGVVKRYVHVRVQAWDRHGNADRRGRPRPQGRHLPARGRSPRRQDLRRPRGPDARSRRGPSSSATTRRRSSSRCSSSSRASAPDHDWRRRAFWSARRHSISHHRIGSIVSVLVATGYGRPTAPPPPCAADGGASRRARTGLLAGLEYRPRHPPPSHMVVGSALSLNAPRVSAREPLPRRRPAIQRRFHRCCSET